MILPVPIYGQRDPRWASQRLGTVDATTIGSHGCVVASMSMLSTYYNHPIFPNQLDDILTDRGLYYDGNLFVNDSITKIFPDIKFDKVVFCDTVPAPIVEIKKYLDAGKPVVVALINEGIRHYVLAVGYQDNQIIVNDPWRGDQVSINSRWGDSALKILQVNFFSGPVPKDKPISPPPPQTPTPATTIIFNDQTKINLGSELGIMEVQAIRSQILDQRRTIQSQERLLAEANQIVEEALATPSISDTTLIDLGSLGRMTIPTIKDEIQALRSANTNLQSLITQKDQDAIFLQQKITDLEKTISKLNEKQNEDNKNDDQEEEEDKDKENNPLSDNQKSKNNPWASRKLWLSVAAAFVAFLNSNLNLNLDTEKLLTIIGPLLAYVGVEGIADIVERARISPKSK